jgi:hypothetical protein
MELVGICDTWEERLKQVGQKYGVVTYTDYDAFFEHDMEAVFTANYFHEHAPFAIKALRAGKHVMSGCAACHTLAESEYNHPMQYETRLRISPGLGHWRNNLGSTTAAPMRWYGQCISRIQCQFP